MKYLPSGVSNLDVGGSLDEKKTPPKRQMPEQEQRRRRSRPDPQRPSSSQYPIHPSLVAFPIRLRLEKKIAGKNTVPYTLTVQSQAGVAARGTGSPSRQDQGSSQIVLGVRALVASMTSSRWLHMATNRSKKSFPLPSPYTSLPHFSISACMVPLRLKVLRHRMMRAR